MTDKPQIRLTELPVSEPQRLVRNEVRGTGRIAATNRQSSLKRGRSWLSARSACGEPHGAHPRRVPIPWPRDHRHRCGAPVRPSRVRRTRPTATGGPCCMTALVAPLGTDITTVAIKPAGFGMSAAVLGRHGQDIHARLQPGGADPLCRAGWKLSPLPAERPLTQQLERIVGRDHGPRGTGSRDVASSVTTRRKYRFPTGAACGRVPLAHARSSAHRAWMRGRDAGQLSLLVVRGLPGMHVATPPQGVCHLLDFRSRIRDNRRDSETFAVVVRGLLHLPRPAAESCPGASASSMRCPAAPAGGSSRRPAEPACRLGRETRVSSASGVQASYL